MYFLDSNILIDFSRRKLKIAYDMLMSSDADLFKVPVIVQGELLVGAEKSQDPEKEKFRVESLLLPFEIIPFDSACAAQYAKVRAYLEKEGMRIGDNDCMIAAQALVHGATLVTNNEKDFKRIPWLSIECWEEVDF